jgi:hypothetical protein
MTPACGSLRDGRYREIAIFDIQLTDDVRLFDLRLFQSDSGNKIIRAPQTRDRRSATFSPTLAREITALASSHFTDFEGTSLETAA